MESSSSNSKILNLILSCATEGRIWLLAVFILNRYRCVSFNFNKILENLNGEILILQIDKMKLNQVTNVLVVSNSKICFMQPSVFHFYCALKWASWFFFPCFLLFLLPTWSPCFLGASCWYSQVIHISENAAILCGLDFSFLPSVKTIFRWDSNFNCTFSYSCSKYVYVVLLFSSQFMFWSILLFCSWWNTMNPKRNDY